MPTPMPHSSQVGWANAGSAGSSPTGVAATAAISMASPSRSIPRIGSEPSAGSGDPVGEHDVQHEAEAVGEGEDEPPRLPAEPHLDQARDAEHGQREGADVAAAPGAPGREHQGAEELEGADGRQRQPVAGEVEQRVHRREHGAEADEHPPLRPRRGPPQPPRAAPESEHGRGGGDPQPRHAEDVDPGEQQDRQRRSEVVEDGAGEEVRGRWQAGDALARRRHDLMVARSELDETMPH